MRPFTLQWMVIACLFILLNLFLVPIQAAGNQVGTEVGVYSFSGSGGAPSLPYVGLIQDSAGHLYGTTEFGGTYNHGTVFEVTPSANSNWTESVLYSFTGGQDGSQPSGGLTFDAAGNLYGTTNSGGSSNCKLGCGTVFKLTPTRLEYELRHLEHLRSQRAGGDLGQFRITGQWRAVRHRQRKYL